MTTRIAGWGWLLVAALALTGCGGGGLESGSVRGWVFRQGTQLVLRGSATPQTGEVAVAGATVYVESGGTVVGSEADGSFQIDLVPVGVSLVRADLDGYTSAQHAVTVVAGQTTTIGSTSSAARQWLVMLYLNGDNAREAAALAAVNELEKVAAGTRVSVVCQLDRAPGFDTSDGDWTGARRFAIIADGDETRLGSARTVAEGGQAEDLGEVDMGDPATLAEFIAAARAGWPATRQALILFGEGSGVRGRGLGYDQTSGSQMSLPQLYTALPGSGQLDVLAFDAGLMQLLEVAYEVRNKVALVVGGQSLQPPDGYPYGALLAGLQANPSQSGADLARAFVETTVDHYAGRHEIAQSALRTADLGEVRRSLDTVAQRLQTIGAERHEAIVEAWEAAQRFSTDPRYAGFVDLLDWLNRLRPAVNDGTLTIQVIDLVAKLNNVILAERHTGGGVANAGGVSLYLPERADWLGPGVGGETPTRAAYRQLRLAADSRWDEWLDDFCGRLPAP